MADEERVLDIVYLSFSTVVNSLPLIPHRELMKHKLDEQTVSWHKNWDQNSWDQKMVISGLRILEEQ